MADGKNGEREEGRGNLAIGSNGDEMGLQAQSLVASDTGRQGQWR